MMEQVVPNSRIAGCMMGLEETWGSHLAELLVRAEPSSPVTALEMGYITCCCYHQLKEIPYLCSALSE